MSNQRRRVWLFGLAMLGLACGGTLKTGVTKKPPSKPTEDGTCASGLSLCGTGAFAMCRDLQNDPEHCGACETTCAPGIVCAAGACQQAVCQGQIPLLPASGTGVTGVPTTDSYHGAILADVNGDGHLDLIDWQPSWTSGQGAFRVSLGKSGGGFEPAQTYTTDMGIQEIVAADINEDGADDLFIAGWAASACVSEWLGHPDGHLTQESGSGVTGCLGTVAIGDVSGDGRVDLVTVSDGEMAFKVFLSDSTGGLHLSRTYPMANYLSEIFIADMNQDGYPDIVVPSTSLQLLYNRGDGTFDDAVDCGLHLSSNIVLADFNHDGHLDLAAGHASGVGVLLGLGGCGFGPFADYEMSASCAHLYAADMNGDGELDLLATSTSSWNRGNLLTILLGKPDGSFQAQEPPTVLSPPLTSPNASADPPGVVVGDIDGDGRPDIIVLGRDGSVSVLENTCQ